jgi:hypoxanthine phosphoribosyltransferase
METLGISFRDNKVTHHTKFKPIKKAKYLIVDDINDSGTTFKVISDVFRDKRLDKDNDIVHKVCQACHRC